MSLHMARETSSFFNLAFNFNPAVLLTVPSSTLGAGVIILPTKDPKEAVISMMVIDSDGRANTSGFDTAFEGNKPMASKAGSGQTFSG